MNKLSILIAIVIASTAFAQQQQVSASIDTWIEGAVVSLDADGQKFAVRGVKLPFASAEAEMMKEIADDTKDLDAAKRDAKIAEIKQKWADKLNKAKSEQIAQNPSDFNFSLPDKANLVILDDKQLMREGAGQEALNKSIAVEASSSAKASAQSADNTLPKSEVDKPVAEKADADKSVTAKAEVFDRKELTALRTLKDLKIGEKVKVGFDAGLISNTAYVIVNDQQAVVR
jgi:hypothetical protein